MGTTLKGKVAIITGGGKGIGKGIALKFAQEGAKVCIGCNSNSGMALETLKELQQYTEAICVQADVGTEEGCQKLVDETVKAFGGIDIYVNNAAMQTQYSLLEQREMDNFDLELTVNVRACMLMFQKVLPYLKKSGHGRIIVITSVHGKRPFVGDACYAISKSCLKMLYREAAVEFAQYGITVNAIAPGGVKIEFKTAAGGKAGPDENRVAHNARIKVDRSGKKRMFGFPGYPKDIAEMAAFIAGFETEYMTGATFRLDGGNCLMV